MSRHEDVFDIVRRWWGSGSVRPDTTQLGIDVSTIEGSFECFILAVLYSIDEEGDVPENTFVALRNEGYTHIDFLSAVHEKSKDWANIESVFDQYYRHGRLKTSKTRYIVEGSKRVVLELTYLTQSPESSSWFLLRPDHPQCRLGWHHQQ